LKKEDTNVKAKDNNGGVRMERIPYGKYTKGFREEAVREVTEYIEIFYNHQRLQVRLGYLSPIAFEKRYYTYRRRHEEWFGVHY
jgi:transposase InsO family protein